MSKLTREEVEHIAALARLEITDDEKVLFGDQLSSILAYVDKLATLDTSPVPETAYILDVTNTTRDDVIEASGSTSREILLDNFPDRKDDLLKVPAVF